MLRRRNWYIGEHGRVGDQRMKQVIVIPARMKGTRLPGKPLIDLCGKPMVQRVWERCVGVLSENEVYVATEDAEIVEFCEGKGIQVVNTGPAESAIARVKLFADVVNADGYINIQGDEPLANQSDIRTILEYNRKWPGRVVCGKTKATKEEFYDISKAKVVCAWNNRLLYSTRAGVPLSNQGGFVCAERAIWLYGFPKNALDQYYNGGQYARLEGIEDNEIIRFLELGVEVYCADVIGDSWAVDVPQDVEVVRTQLRERGEGV